MISTIRFVAMKNPRGEKGFLFFLFIVGRSKAENHWIPSGNFIYKSEVQFSTETQLLRTLPVRNFCEYFSNEEMDQIIFCILYR